MKQMLKKIIIGICVCTIAVTGIYFCKNENKDMLVENVNKASKEENNVLMDDKAVDKDVILEVESNADFKEEYDTIEELCKVSDEIVKGTVVSEQAFCDDTGTVFTCYKICVKETIHGILQVCDEVDVIDFGGTIDAAEYFNKQTDPKALEVVTGLDSLENKVVEYDFEGAWRPSVGEEYIWYLEKKIEDDGEYYCPVNCYQGVFEIQNNEAERYASDDNSKEYVSEIEEKEMCEIVNEVTEYEKK